MLVEYLDIFLSVIKIIAQHWYVATIKWMFYLLIVIIIMKYFSFPNFIHSYIYWLENLTYQK